MLLYGTFHIRCVIRAYARSTSLNGGRSDKRYPRQDLARVLQARTRPAVDQLERQMSLTRSSNFFKASRQILSWAPGPMGTPRYVAWDTTGVPPNALAAPSAARTCSASSAREGTTAHLAGFTMRPVALPRTVNKAAAGGVAALRLRAPIAMSSAYRHSWLSGLGRRFSNCNGKGRTASRATLADPRPDLQPKNATAAKLNHSSGLGVSKPQRDADAPRGADGLKHLRGPRVGQTRERSRDVNENDTAVAVVRGGPAGDAALERNDVVMSAPTGYEPALAFVLADSTGAKKRSRSRQQLLHNVAQRSGTDPVWHPSRLRARGWLRKENGHRPPPGFRQGMFVNPMSQRNVQGNGERLAGASQCSERESRGG